MNKDEYEKLVEEQKYRRPATTQEMEEIKQHFRWGMSLDGITQTDSVEIISRNLYEIRVAEAMRSLIEFDQP